jgi:hypothetical protein
LIGVLDGENFQDGSIVGDGHLRGQANSFWNRRVSCALWASPVTPQAAVRPDVNA